jgi:hypothetical protein
MLFGKKHKKQKQGNVDLYVDGQPSTQAEVTAICQMCENYSYMADYVIDDNGILKEIRYDKVQF